MAPTRNTLSKNVRTPSVEFLNEPHVIEPRMVEPWRGHALGCLRKVFGLVWAIGATFKWQPAFQTHFLTDGWLASCQFENNIGRAHEMSAQEAR